MGKHIDLPQLPQGKPQEQLEALYSYLYRMAEALNSNLAEIGSGTFTDEEMAVVREVTGVSSTEMPEVETLKSLIIKTAQFIRSAIDEYNMKLVGTYEAEGKLGRYVRKTRLDVDVTPDGIQQNYSFQEIIQGLKTYEINAKNYIKTGYLRTENSLPVYGVAIGKDVVTFSEDGTETYNDGNKVAELTADELSFWQNGNKVAGYTGTAITFYAGTSKRMEIDGDGIKFYKGSTTLAELLGTALKFYYNGTLRTQMDTDGVKIYDGSTLLAKIAGSRIGFYSGGTEVFYIENGKLTSAADMEISAGNKFKISSGGALDVDTNNFILDSANKTMQTGRWILNDYGLVCDEVSDAITFGKYGVNFSVSGKPSTNIAVESMTDKGWYYFSHRRSNGNFSGRVIMLTGDPAVANTSYSAMIYTQVFNGTLMTPAHGCLGTNSGEWDIWADEVHYYTLTQRSSREVKHDIRDLPEMGEKIDRLRPVTFIYDRDPQERTRTGLIYEETEPVMPEICTGDESSKAINYVELIPILLKEIQELRARVKALEERGGA